MEETPMSRLRMLKLSLRAAGIAVCETGKPTLGTRMLFVLFGLMAPFSPKSARSEHWPL